MENRKLIYVLVVFAVVAGSCKAFDAIKDLSKEKYLGRWYTHYMNAFAEAATGADDDTDCITATYGNINDTHITVLNANTRDGIPFELSGVGYIPDLTDPAKLLVGFRGEPLDGEYWIIKLGPIINDQYQYTIISESTGRNLFVLSRDEQTFKELYEDEVLEYVQLTGFTGAAKAPKEKYLGSDCLYPPLP